MGVYVKKNGTGKKCSASEVFGSERCSARQVLLYMHTKYENNSSTGSWDMSKYVFSAIGDLVSEVKGQGQFWHHDIIDTSYLISEYQRESVKWIHCWNNWHWTLSFSWIWPYWITLGKYKMADISKTRKILTGRLFDKMEFKWTSIKWI